MSRTLALQLSDEAFEALRRLAHSTRTSPAILAADALERQFGVAGLSTTEAANRAARERFESQLGSVDLGAATGPENESIDADLAREYARTPGEP